MKTSLLPLTAALLGCSTLSGCSRYAFSINDNEVYTPPPLYANFEIADEALDTCIRQTIADQRVTRPEQLTSLRCSHAGIKSLAGLEHFAHLRKLDLSDNNIRSGEVLRHLEQLELVKLIGNTQLDCADLTGLADADVIPPQHCAPPR